MKTCFLLLGLTLFCLPVYPQISPDKFFEPIPPSGLSGNNYILGVDNFEKVYYYNNAVFEYSYKNNSWFHNSLLDPFDIDRMYFDSLNVAWFFSGNEIYQMNSGNAPVQITTNLFSGFSQVNIYGTYMDESNNLWACGTYQNGYQGFILKFSPQNIPTFYTFTLAGQFIDFPGEIRVSNRGDIWILAGWNTGGNFLHLFKYDNNNYLPVNVVNFGLYPQIASIDVDHSGNLLLLGSDPTFYDMRLVRYDGTSFTQFTNNSSSVTSGPVDVLASSNGDIWISGDGLELFKFDGVSFTTYIAPYSFGFPKLIQSKEGILFTTDIDHFLAPIMFSENGFNAIRGIFYFDINGDGIKQPGENKLVNQQTKMVPGNLLAFSDYNGYNFTTTDTSGSYLVSCDVPLHWHLSNIPTTYTVIQNHKGQISTNIDFGFTPDFSFNDAAVNVSMEHCSPGSTEFGYLFIENKGSNIINDTITGYLPLGTTFIAGCQSPFLISGNMVKWHFSLQPFAHQFFPFTVQVDPGVAIGSSLHFSVIANPLAGDLNPSDNTDSIDVVVTGPFDPNEKVVQYANSNINGYINPGQDLTYTIFFQNTGTDTAFNVIIKDTLSSFLDLNSLRILGSRHTFIYDLHNNVLRFIFNDINLPDSNTNELFSHGFISFAVKAKGNLLNGTNISNTSYIFFDYNSPIKTNATSNTILITAIDYHLPKDKSNVYPNPTEDNIILEWNSILPEKIVVNLYDITGVLAINKIIYTSTGLNKFDIETNDLSSGVYLLSVNNGINDKKYKVLKINSRSY